MTNEKKEVGHLVGVRLDKRLFGLISLYCNIYKIPKGMILKNAVEDLFAFTQDSDMEKLNNFMGKASAYYQRQWDEKKVSSEKAPKFKTFINSVIKELERLSFDKSLIQEITKKIIE